MINQVTIDKLTEMRLTAMRDAIMDRITYDSYKIDIESLDPEKDLSMREVYGLNPTEVR